MMLSKSFFPYSWVNYLLLQEACIVRLASKDKYATLVQSETEPSTWTYLCTYDNSIQIFKWNVLDTLDLNNESKYTSHNRKPWSIMLKYPEGRNLVTGLLFSLWTELNSCRNNHSIFRWEKFTCLLSILCSVSLVLVSAVTGVAVDTKYINERKWDCLDCTMTSFTWLCVPPKPFLQSLSIQCQRKLVCSDADLQCATMPSRPTELVIWCWAVSPLASLTKH